MWVMQRMKSAAISRGLVKSASLLERTVNNPVRFYQPSSSSLTQCNDNGNNNNNKLCGSPPQYAPALCDLDLDLLTLKVVSRVTGDVGYLCANCSLPRPHCSKLRPDVRDRQSDRQTSDSIIAECPHLGGGSIISTMFVNRVLPLEIGHCWLSILMGRLFKTCSRAL